MPRPLSKSRGYDDNSFRWMPGLNETVDGLMRMGHHAKAGTQHAFLPHTEDADWDDFSTIISGKCSGWTDVRPQGSGLVIRHSLVFGVPDHWSLLGSWVIRRARLLRG